jgi:hypothetical protein
VEKKPRKPTGKMKVSTFEKKTGVTLRNKDGRNTRDDKRLRTHRKEENK